MNKVKHYDTSSKERVFEEDILLRAHEFRILRRPLKGEAVWTRNGEEYKHSEAVQMVKWEQEAEAVEEACQGK